MESTQTRGNDSRSLCIGSVDRARVVAQSDQRQALLHYQLESALGPNLAVAVHCAPCSSSAYAESLKDGCSILTSHLLNGGKEVYSSSFCCERAECFAQLL